MEPRNPYDAPSAALQARTVGDDAELLSEPAEVPAGDAMEWFATGWEYVMRDPGTWIGIFVLMVISSFVLSCIPLGTNLVLPVMTAGVAMGADAQRRGEPLSVECLFAGFRSPHIMQLLLIGVFTLVGTLLAMVVVMPIMFGMSALAGNADGDSTMGIVMVVVMVAAIFLVVIPLTMATIFAPMLVAFHGLSAMDALLLSLRGCLRNIGAGLVWILVSIVVAILASLPLFLGWLVAAPVMMVANYAAYRAIFVAR